ncbi:MAG: 50S ribosomal protein L11 methyltransferase [Lachnospiraceae bacterium]|nr:50S ribosomal protein L11 methyltransferase [Lachnospiraceae bacterium]
MKWTRFKIQTTTEAEDIIIADLYDVGLEGAQIEDKIPLTPLEKEQMFVDILPETEADDGIAYLSFFVEQDDAGNCVLNGESKSVDAIRDLIKETLAETASYMDIGSGSIAVTETEDIDWINNWKNYFHQFHVDDLLVIPSWETVAPEDQDKKILHIDPGTAFGTGMHETTQLCIRQIWKHLTPETKLLDVGTGSGILSIVALMYGAKSAVGTDLDPCAEPAVKDNMKANGIPEEQFRFILGNIISDQAVQDEVGYGCYDIVVANILHNVLTALTPVITAQLKEGGIYITSGILNEKEQVVRDAMEQAGLTILEVTRQGEWCSITAQK